MDNSKRNVTIRRELSVNKKEDVAFNADLADQDDREAHKRADAADERQHERIDILDYER